MLAFHETKGGHEFLYGTMPKLAREVERLANAVEGLNIPAVKTGSMTYEDFYDIAVYGNNNWKGSFTQKEIACYAYDYLEEYRVSITKGSLTHTMRELYEMLSTDGDDDATEWANRIISEVAK